MKLLNQILTIQSAVCDQVSLTLGLVLMKFYDAHSAPQEALCKDEGKSGSVPLSRPHVCQPKAIHQGTRTLAPVRSQHRLVARIFSVGLLLSVYR